MHNQFVRWLFRTTAFILAFSTVAEPADLSIQAYQDWQQRAKQEIEKEIKEEFAEREAELETLSDPFKLGENVEVIVIQGDRRRVIKGRFKDISGNIAEIGERKILLRDMRQVDVDRLRFGKHPELLQLKLDQLRQQLEVEKNKVRQVRLEQKHRQAGYTDQFFESTEELGGRYWTYEALGENQVEVLARYVTGQAYVEVVILNKSGTSSSTLVILGNKPVASTITTDPEQLPEYEESAWSKFQFQLNREDLGENPWETLANELKLWTVRQDTGSWQFTLGSPKARGNTARFRTKLPRLRIKEHTPVNLRNMRRFSQAAATYQVAIKEAVAKQQEAIAAANKAARDKELAEEQERERRRLARIAAVAARQKAEANDIWLTAEEAQAASVGSRMGRDRRVLTDDTYDNINYPTRTTIDDQEYHILKFTEWEKRKAKTPPRNPLALYEVISVRYRVMRLMYHDVYKRKMAALEKAKAVPDTPAGNTEVIEIPEEYEEFDFPGGGPPPGYPGARGVPRGVVQNTPDPADPLDQDKTLVELLEELDDQDELDKRPDPGYLLQYRVEYQNRLSKESVFTAVLTIELGGTDVEDKGETPAEGETAAEGETPAEGETAGNNVTWKDEYVAESQYLGPLYGSYRLTLEQFSLGIEAFAIEIEISGAEAERERLAKEREIALEKARDGTLVAPSSSGGSGSTSGGGSKPKPPTGLFD